jgi:mannose-6-phosphate isomerase-like protein (cupin superfamily)
MNEMSKPAAQKGRYVVVGPDEGRSFWQPDPSTGWSEVKVSPFTWGSNQYSAGVQVLEPGAHVREHAHQRNEEMLFVFEGEGVGLIDDAEYQLKPGTLIVVDRFVQHKLTNTGTTPMKIFWTILPPGLENWFAAIGRPRDAGDAGPAPVFSRPDDVADVQRAMFFQPPEKPVDDT